MPVRIRHVSPPSSPSHRDRLREELKGVHTHFHIKEVIDFCLAHGRAPLDLSQDDLEILQSKYAQLSLALEESLMLPLRIAVDLLQPSPPIESSLHLMLIPSSRFVIASWTSPIIQASVLFQTVRVQGTTTAVIFVTVAVRKNAF